MDKIILKGMSFFAYHGVLDSEKSQGQEFVIDVEMGADTSAAAAGGDLDLTVDYSLVYNLIAGVVTDERYDLLETLAEKIAETVLAHRLIREVRVLVKKTKPPIEGDLQWAGIEITRSK